MLNYLKDVDEIFLKLSSLILIDPEVDCELREVHSLSAMRLLLQILKSDSAVGIDALSYVDFDNVIAVTLHFEGKTRIAAYRMLGKAIRTRSSLVGKICDAGLLELFPRDIEDGSYSLRVAVVRLISRILEFASFDPRTKVLSSVEFLRPVLDFVDADSRKLDLAVLRSFSIVLDQLLRTGHDDIMAIVSDEDFLNLLDRFSDDELFLKRGIAAASLRNRIQSILPTVEFPAE
jgi:hypothetical protein